MMEAITWSEYQEKAVIKAASVIASGGLVAVPTDTVYGIVGDATRAEVIERLYTLKKRSKEKAFPVFVRDVAMARLFAYISDTKAILLKTIWPGPVTVIFHHKEKLPHVLTANQDTIALRIPKHPFFASLLSRVDVPLVQSSANLSHLPPATNSQDIITLFAAEQHKPDLLIDGGEVVGTPSTIVDFTTNELRFVRSGVMSKNDLDSFFQNFQDGNS